MVRFVEADESVVEVYIKAMEHRFPSLAQLKIKLIFDTKFKEALQVALGTDINIKIRQVFNKNFK